MLPTAPRSPGKSIRRGLFASWVGLAFLGEHRELRKACPMRALASMRRLRNDVPAARLGSRRSPLSQVHWTCSHAARDVAHPAHATKILATEALGKTKKAPTKERLFHF